MEQFVLPSLKGIEMRDPIATFFSIAMVVVSMLLLGALRYADVSAVSPEQHVPMVAFVFAFVFLVIGTALTSFSCVPRMQRS